MSRTSPSPHGLRRTLTVALAMAVFLTACGGGSANDVSEAAEESAGPVLAGYERDPEPTVGLITLPAANRDTDAFAFKADPGKLMMVTFGFTSCPDICPTTLADMRVAFNQLEGRSEQVDLAWVSIDPERDTAEVAANYVEAFVADGIALRTDDAQELLIAADAFGVTYVVQKNDDGETEVGHTPNVYVVDDSGSIVLTWSFGVPANDISSDLNILLDRYEATTP